jgi:uncharacterized cupredoxin-like copper-binding protein
MRRGAQTLLLSIALLSLASCGGSGGSGVAAGWATIAALPNASPSTGPSPAPRRTVTVALGETSPTQMYIHMSATTAPSGTVTFVVTNEGNETHEFVVLQTPTPADQFPISSFEGETDRFNEDTAGVNVGETGDMKPGETKALVIKNMLPGHYAVACNLPGHYRMGMHQDFTVT